VVFVTDVVHYWVVDRVAVLTIDNPPVNALSALAWSALDHSIARAVADSAADAIVMIGAGSSFVAGADIRVFDTLKTARDSLSRSAGIHASLRRIEDSPKPVIAAIRGYALGGGNELAMACHYRIAVADAKVGQPEVLLGLIPGAAGTQRLPRLVGPELAMRMCTDGKPISGLEALAAGLVDGITSGDLLDSAVRYARSRAVTRKTRDLTDRIANKPHARLLAQSTQGTQGGAAPGSQASQAAMVSIQHGIDTGFDAGSIRERELFAQCLFSTESKALRHQFFAKRAAAKAARFQGDP
jgi:3-hydroxyacyl-CoA dehydrogenase